MKREGDQAKRMRTLIYAFMFMAALSFIAPGGARAQWTTNGNDINNTNAGNVGIGTTTPADKLDVAGRVRFSINLTTPGNNIASVYRSGATGLSFSGFNGSFSSWYFSNNLSQDVMYNPVGTTTVGFAGNIGVGTATPTSTQGGITGASGRVLQIQNPADVAQFIISSGAGTGAYLSFEVTNGTVGKRLFQQYYDGAANALRFRTVNEANGIITQDNIFTLGNNGYVGVGLSAPQSVLHAYRQNNSGITSVIADNDGTGINTAQAFQFRYGSTGILGGIYHQWDGTRWVLRFKAWTNSGAEAERLFIQGDSGNVGIGAPALNYRLDVGGQINASTGLCINGDCKSSWSAVGGSQWTTSGSSIYYSTGNVAIGTNNPGAAALYVKGSGSTLMMFERATVSTVYGFEQASNVFGLYNYSSSRYAWRTNNNDLLLNESGGNVGIGTTSPGKALVVQNDLANNQLAIIRPTTNPATLNIGIDNTGPFMESVTANKPISFYTNNGTNIAERVRIDKDGNMGIGTTSPTKRLTVNGDIEATGSINAKYQDVAEWVPSRQKLPPGTVVILDPEKSNQVIASTQPYDTRVAGVVSDQPGVLLGEGGEDKLKVATTGRVRVRVNATRGPIKIGDLLVASDEEGVAMKSEPVNVGGVLIHRPGTIIGKALEPLEKGKGEILVLLSLQ